MSISVFFASRRTSRRAARTLLATLVAAAVLLPAASVITATPSEARYCLNTRVSATGGGRTRVTAKYWARRHWRRNARNRHGRCFDNYTLSRDKRWSCRRDSRRHRTCEVSARPCSTCGTLYD